MSITSDRSEAKEFGLRAIALPLPGQGHHREVALASAEALIATGTSADFAAVWPLVTSDVVAGLEILGADAPHSESSPLPLLARLVEDQIATLYLWLSTNRPRGYQEDQFGFVGPNERLEALERNCLDRLQTIGTLPAVQAIARIRLERPQLQWLQMIEDDAQRALRSSQGARPAPIDVLRMADDHGKRYIGAEENLLKAVTSSLDGLQSELSGDDPLVRFLWGLEPLAPRDEIDISIFVTVHLRRDLTRQGVILNREVNISRISRTDIRVEAVAPDPSQRPIAITIEVKGSWHRELMTAMKEQLRDKYLANGTGKAGLYLVAWTRGIDTRGPDLTAEEARSTLAQQARELSTDTILIESYVLDCTWREETPRSNRGVATKNDESPRTESQTPSANFFRGK